MHSKIEIYPSQMTGIVGARIPEAIAVRPPSDTEIVRRKADGPAGGHYGIPPVESRVAWQAAIHASDTATCLHTGRSPEYAGTGLDRRI
jgi:hypothetical protein